MSVIVNVLLALALAFWASGVSAVTEVITSKSRFLTLTGAVEVSDSYPEGNLGAVAFESGSVTFTPVSGSGLFFSDWTPLFPGNDLALNGSTNLNLDLAFATAAVGFDLADSGTNSTFTVRLRRDGVTLASVQVNTGSATRFVGIWSDQSFTQVEIREDSGGAENEFFGTIYAGGFKNRDISSNVPALVCQFPLLAAHNFALGASLVAPPPLDLGFGLGAHSANLTLKFCLPFALAPPDIITYADDPFNADPDSPEACFKTFDHKRVHSQFTNVLGIPVQYDYDWGELGTPQVVHQNSDVEVYMLRGKRPPFADDASLAAFLGDEFATDGIYSDCDGVKEVSNTGHLCPYSSQRALTHGVGRGNNTYRFDVNMGLLDFVFVPVPKFPQGTKNPAVKQFALEVLVEVTQIVWDIALGGWRFGNFVDRNQVVAVYDVTPPEIKKALGDFNGDGQTNAADQSFIDNVVIEADEIGGVSASRFRSFLRSMYSTSDACGRSVTFFEQFPNDELKVFWPVTTTAQDTSFVVTWKAQDPGPNVQGLRNESTTTQRVTVVDTRPPEIQPPMDIVELTSDTQVTLDLGQPLVFDLVDLNPVITNDAQFPLSPGIHTITWTAIDASGNSASALQRVNIKNSNLEPSALSQSGAQRLNAVSFEPMDVRIEGSDPDSDPLNFFIEDYPQDGFFVAPLYPFFIEDYRLEASFSDADVVQFCADRPGGSDFLHLPVIRSPIYFSVLDDGTTYVLDVGYVQCRESLSLPPSFSERIAVFDATGAFVAGQDTNGIPDDFYIDIRTDRVYTTSGELSNGFINMRDADLNRIQNYNLFSMRDRNNRSVNIPFAEAAIADTQGILYVLSERGDVHAVRADLDPNGDTIRPEYLGLVLDTRNQGTNFDMAIDTEDNLFVSMGNRVYKIPRAFAQDDGYFAFSSEIRWMGKCTADRAPGDQAVCDLTNERSLGYSCTDEWCDVGRGDQPGQFDDPRGIAIDPNNNLYVTDFQNFRVQRFTPDGFFAGQAESECDGNCFVIGDFGRPNDIAVNSDHFFILDTNTDLLHISQTSPFKEIGDDYAVLEYSSNNDFACLLSADCVDTFTFSVSDGVRDPDTGQMQRSAPALVEIEVARNFRPPFATSGIIVEVREDTPTIITLDGSDPDPLDMLTFAVSQMPQHGSLSLVGNQATYTPDQDYVGEDGFSFTASDGVDTSAPEVLSIIVENENDPAVVTFDDAVITAARGFDTAFEGTLTDPDAEDRHSLLVRWNDGSADEPEGDISMMGNISGPLLMERSTGDGSIRANHVFDNAGNFTVEFCVTDQVTGENKTPTANSLTLCSPIEVSVEDLLDLSLALEGPDVLVRGQSSNYVITLTNEQPASGAGLTATGITAVIDVDPILLSSPPSGCNAAGNRFSCSFNDLAPGDSQSITVPIIVPADPGTQAGVVTEVDVAVDQPDRKQANKLVVTTPLAFDADLVIGGQGDQELVDDQDFDLGDGVCAGGNTGTCNLRAAVMEANASASIQSIALGNGVFALSASAAVSPDSGYGDLDVFEDLTIIGNGPENTFINAGGIDRGFEVFATLVLEGVTLSGGLTNIDEGLNGAGILIGSNGRVILRNVRITGNDAVGDGGAIYVDNNVADALVIENSVISANSGANGGGIFVAQGGAQLTNVTLSSNRASGSGGGLMVNGGALTQLNVTLAGNSAASGGGALLGAGTLDTTNSLFARNIASDGPDCLAQGGALISRGGNLVERADDCAGWNFSNDKLNVSPGITELRDNDGPTRTYALTTASPALDGGLLVPCPATDQRGMPRATDGIGNGQPGCDVGAYEAAGVPLQETIFANSFE
ncbi:MAG: choice-of-anchor Q domain-containing protein [Lysobacterales bacterium]